MLDALLQQLPGVWRADSLTHTQGLYIPTGYPTLDAALGGGWPMPALIELLCDQQGIGELQLLLPLISQVCAPQDDGPGIALWLNPPHVLQATALAQYGLNPAQQWITDELSSRDTLWAMEQALRSGGCALVIAWAARVNLASLRRLKLASALGRCVGVLFRPAYEKSQASPANVRLELHAHGSCLHINVLKVRGRLPSAVMLDVQSRAP